MKKADLDLCYLSASEALDKFKSRELSPVELCTALIQRNEEVGDKLNATTYTFFERALKEARVAEAKYMKPKARRPRPLEGIAVGIKDFHSVKGEITTYGSKAYEGYKPDQTAPTVERLLTAGAILFSRTTTPEFAYSGVTRSPLWGVTRNPWNQNCTPGDCPGRTKEYARCRCSFKTTRRDGRRSRCRVELGSARHLDDALGRRFWRTDW